MTDNTINRAHELVEELRADIDFEIDDVIAHIIRDLPEDYFRRLERKDQLTHLKTLLAISVCHLDEEIMLRSSDGRHIAVVARQDYPGLLANILTRLPTDEPLIGAKIFSSKAHDFIIDLFEFESKGTFEAREAVEPNEIENSINQVARMTGKDAQTIASFISTYPPSSQVLTSPDDIYEHFLAYLNLKGATVLSVRWSTSDDSNAARVTIAASSLSAREVFQRSAEFLARESLDIEQAFLNDLSTSEKANIAISSFILSDKLPNQLESKSIENALIEYLKTGRT